MFFLKSRRGFISADIIAAISISFLISYVIYVSVSNMAKFDNKENVYKKIIYSAEEALNQSLDDIENGNIPDENVKNKIINNNVLTISYEIIDEKRKIYKVSVQSDKKEGGFILLEGYEKRGIKYE